jgi:hypothetical protein
VKTRNWLATLFGALALVTFSIVGNAYMAPHAHAQPLAQARPVTSAAGLRPAQIGYVFICLYENGNECIKSNGGGNQVTIEPTNWAIFHVVNTSGNWEQLQNDAGKCLREYADSSVVMAFGGCDSTNAAEWWYDSNPGGSRTTLLNDKYSNNYMGTFGTNSGLGVWAGPQQSGFYVGWVER